MSSYGTLPPTPWIRCCARSRRRGHTKGETKNYGVPPECDPDEGWILDPALLDE